MSDYLNPALEELKELVASTWPDVVDGDGGKRIYEAEHIALVPFEELTLPVAVIVADGQPWSEAPLARASSWTLLDVQVYYVGRSAGSPAPVRTKVQALKDALKAATPTYFQVYVPAPNPQWSWSLDINKLLRGKKLQALGGRLSCHLLAGEE